MTDSGSAAVSGWSLAFALPGGQAVTNAWSAAVSPNGGQVTARNVSYNGTIAPGGSAEFGFQADHTGNTGKPASFTLNGTACIAGRPCAGGPFHGGGTACRTPAVRGESSSASVGGPRPSRAGRPAAAGRRGSPLKPTVLTR
ncbi:cellulose binding domain-containing protein [Planomonospora sp. ID82291]|uniref:cellulose binding domain-containing protein n=1 Tax=Planomonospora sp. ID82291 TaxID=2738136 RepID=UPI0027DEA8B9|nr:cellulose binding domain-containing protein [Planomonospora sp. ID82291]